MPIKLRSSGAVRVCGVVLCVYVHMIRVTASRTWVSILWANLIIPTAVIVLYIPWTPRLLRARVAVWCVCVRARVRVLLLLCVCVVTQHIGSAHTSSKSNSSTRLCAWLQHIFTTHCGTLAALTHHQKATPPQDCPPSCFRLQPQANNHKPTTTREQPRH